MRSHAGRTASCSCKCTHDSVALILRVISSAHLELPGSQIHLSPLHNNIAVIVSKDKLEQYINRAKQRSHAAVTLWDGSPPLPVQPSPAAFKFLTQIHRSMSDAGSDLWSIQCVFELRSVIIEALSKRLHEPAFTDATSPNGLTNGHTEEAANDAQESKDDASDQSHDTGTRKEAQMVQKLFDLYYISRVFNPRAVNSRSHLAFADVVGTIKTPLRLDDDANGRLQKSAEEYWKRTYLLFGLLALGGLQSS